MARIDIEALRKAAQGDQDARVTVKRAWLTAVYDEIQSLHQTIAEQDKRRRNLDAIKRAAGAHDQDIMGALSGLFGGKR